MNLGMMRPWIKIKIFVLMLAINYNNKAYCQTNVYHPFPDSNAIWRIDKYDSSTPFGTSIDTYEIYINKDTVINGRTFHNLVSEGDLYINIPWHTTGRGDLGILWQDTIIKQVYFQYYNCTGSNCDSLLYDFNLHIGDTVTNRTEFFTGRDMLIFSIDSVVIGNNYRKRFTIADMNNTPTGEFIVEGIGSSIGGFYQYDYFEQYYDLLCFMIDSNCVYPDTNTNCHLIISDTRDFLLNKVNCVMYPNPFDDKVYINYEGSKLLNRIVIYNLLGEELKNYFTSDKVIYFSESLKPGVYIAKVIYDNNEASHIKLIKK